ncbi:MAG TPA: hypothetical protein ENI15_07870 [Spirochaetes bacterium]|nr:hypothetical protein [Spirochaetota bacterium]
MSGISMTEERNPIAALAEERGNIYGFLALVYQREPDAVLLDILGKQDAALKDLGVDLGKPASSGNKRDIIEELSVEYTRLFLGPGRHISPYESVWREAGGAHWGKSTSEVKNFIETLGLNYTENWTGLPDHIGVEFEFMKKLVDHEKKVRIGKDRKTVRLCLEIQKRFMDEHIYKWVPGFCGKVIEESREDFYRQIAMLTKQFIEFDREQIDGLLEQIM